MKLELKHLAPYLPYELKCRLKFDESQDLPWYYDKNELDLFKLEGMMLDWYGNAILEIKPILRPLSDLTRHIEFDGKKPVPLLELRCIEQGYWDEGEFILNHTQITDYGVRHGDYPAYWVEWKDGLEQTQSFSFKNGDFSRAWIRDRSRIGGIEGCVLNNQILLFQKLYEWHFDIFGLIEEGLAIDINTIK